MWVSQNAQDGDWSRKLGGGGGCPCIHCPLREAFWFMNHCRPSAGFEINFMGYTQNFLNNKNKAEIKHQNTWHFARYCFVQILFSILVCVWVWDDIKPISSCESWPKRVRNIQLQKLLLTEVGWTGSECQVLPLVQTPDLWRRIFLPALLLFFRVSAQICPKVRKGWCEHLLMRDRAVEGPERLAVVGAWGPACRREHLIVIAPPPMSGELPPPPLSPDLVAWLQTWGWS